MNTDNVMQTGKRAYFPPLSWIAMIGVMLGSSKISVIFERVLEWFNQIVLNVRNNLFCFWLRVLSTAAVIATSEILLMPYSFSSTFLALYSSATTSSHILLWIVKSLVNRLDTNYSLFYLLPGVTLIEYVWDMDWFTGPLLLSYSQYK